MKENLCGLRIEHVTVEQVNISEQDAAIINKIIDEFRVEVDPLLDELLDIAIAGDAGTCSLKDLSDRLYQAMGKAQSLKQRWFRRLPSMEKNFDMLLHMIRDMHQECNRKRSKRF